MLTLPIKKKWFDMILSGEKTDEYREVTPYWTTRFCNLLDRGPMYTPCRYVRFRNGYSKDAPSFVAKVIIGKGCGLEQWGAEQDKVYYILHILRIEEQEHD